MAAEAYDEIPTLIPQDLGPDAVKAQNQAFRKAVQAQTGTFLGYHNTMRGRFEVRNVNGQQILMRTDPSDPTQIQVWEPTAPEPHSVPIGGTQFGGALNDLRARVSSTSQNPLTGNAWSKDVADPMTANYGQLRLMDQMRERGQGYTPVSTDEVQEMTAKQQLSQTLQKINADYAAIGGKDNMDKVSQFVQGLSTTDLSKFINSGGDTPERKAYLDLMRNLNVLQANRVNVNRFMTQGSGGAATDSVISALNPVLSIFGDGLIKGIQRVAGGDFEPDALKANTNLARAMIDRSLYNQVSLLANPASKRSLPDQFRKFGTDAANDLISMNIGKNDSVTNAPLIEEPAGTTQQPKTQQPASQTSQVTPSDTTAASSATAALASANAPQTSANASQPSQPNQPNQPNQPQQPQVWHPSKNNVTKAVDAGIAGAEQGIKTFINPVPGPASIAKDRLAPMADIDKINQTMLAAHKGILGGVEAAGDAARNLVRNTLPFGQWIMPGDETTPNIQKGQPLFAKAPHPAPVVTAGSGAGVGSQATAPAAPQSAPAPMPAPLQVQPLETPQIVPQAATGPQKLVTQAEVDALAPGTPFYWQDHPDAYVRA